MKRLLPLLAFPLVWLGDALHAASPIALPPAEWIWAAGEPPPPTAHFARTFHVKPGVQSAVLIGACGGEMGIRLNGRRVGDITGRERGTSFPVASLLRAGPNEITVRATAGANAGVALILQLVLDSGRHEWIVSDGSWRASARDGGEATPVARLGRVDAPGQLNPFDPARAVDAYNSWTLARGASHATDPATVRVPPGFEVELLRSAQPGEDSWVAMAFDPQGRITVAREKQPGLLRFTLGGSRREEAPSNQSEIENRKSKIEASLLTSAATSVTRVELINTNLLECRGLLYAHGALYVHANHSKALYRLRDTRGDDQFDEIKELLRTEGGPGHGRNHLRLGPDGMIYLVMGDDIALPPEPAPTSPFKRFSDPPWIPGPRDPSTCGPGGRLLTGYIARTDPDGARFEVVAGGLRNPLDVAFNEDGEMFTYDADNERDIGNPWYKPSRVHHIVSGGDYAWRRGLGILPSHCPDVLPTLLDVGLGSPTGVEFGTASHFPEKFRRALFIADWAYGRILAIHLQPNGPSYTATREDFATGRPLNVTDMAIGPDGALYFTTGGRQTQSGLYRIRYAGSPGLSRPQSARSPEGGTPNKERELRRQLEAFHGRDNSLNGPEVIAAAWPQLGHADRWVRHAARIALETVPAVQWQSRALAERDADRALAALLALARVGPADAVHPVLERLNRLPLAKLGERQQLDAFRVYELVLPRVRETAPRTAAAAATKLDALYPSASRPVNWELCKLLANLRAPDFIAKTIPLLAAAETQQDTVHYLFFLRHAPGPWTLSQRRVFFEAVRRAEQGQGAQNYVRTVRDIKTAAAATLTDAQRTALAPLLEDKSIVFAGLASDAAPPRFVREWLVEDLEPVLDRAARGRSFAAGRAAYASAQCALCHRVGAGPEAGGLLGPDLTSVAARFSRRDMLDAIINPSRAMDDKYRSTVFRLKDGETVAGIVESEDAAQVLIRPNPLSEETLALRTDDIRSRDLSDISPMPTGLLNALEREQILDLIAYLESGGDPGHAVFSRDRAPRNH